MTTARALTLFFLVLFASGCATNLRVTYNSEPIGAALYEGSTFLGTTPVTINYNVTEEQRKAGRMLLRGTSVRWVSGASANISSLTADMQQYGYHQTFTFRRPDGVPGYDVDANYALQLQRNAIMLLQAASQAQAAQQQQYFQQQQLQLQRQQMLQQQFRPPSNFNCTSNVIGSYIYTNCQ